MAPAEAMKDSRERGLTDEMFRLAVEACPNGMVIIDRDCKMVMVNTEVERQFGYRREELIGRPVDMLVPVRFRAQHIRHCHHFTDHPSTRRMGACRELFGLRKDGTEFPVEVGLNPIRAGDALLVLSVIVDISERKRMERLKDEFVATVSHELRTPLTSISGSLGLLMGKWAGKLPESATRLLAIANKNSQRLVRLLNDILDIEKLESGRVVFNFSQVDVRSLVHQAIEDNRGFAESYGVRIRMEDASADEAIKANVDPDRLAQVMSNLLSNAIKFSPSGDEVLISVQKEETVASISVRDHGPGIPAEFKSHIFEKFAQADATNSRQKGGTGLGLSIVKQIVERFGGEIGFNDAPDGGTIFHVSLPIWNIAADPEIDHEAESGASRVLLCEDDREIAIVMRERLRLAGFAADFAHTAAAAVSCADAIRYAAILVDLQLPDGDGIGLILRMRAQAQYHDTPIIVISGDPSRGRNDERSSRLNVLDWLSKPVDFAHLVQVLRASIVPDSNQRTRILHIDGDRDMLAVVAQALRTTAEVMSADSIENAHRILAGERINLVILDISLTSGSGLDLLPDLRDSSGNTIPVIIFSARGNRPTYAGQVHADLNKSSASIESLVANVHNRLSPLTARTHTEIA